MAPVKWKQKGKLGYSANGPGDKKREVEDGGEERERGGESGHSECHGPRNIQPSSRQQTFSAQCSKFD